MPKTQEETNRLADVITSAVNSGWFNGLEVAKAITHEHRTLQQSFMRLCVAFIEEAAKDTYGFDGRNEDTHELAKVLAKTLEETKYCLSFI